MQTLPLRIESVPGYTPAIGRLVGMRTYARATTLAAVDGLTMSQLDHLHDASSNSIGALLAHVAAVESSYQVLTMRSIIVAKFAGSGPGSGRTHPNVLSRNVGRYLRSAGLCELLNV
jgi:hypothetical protein